MKYFIDTEFHEHKKPIKVFGITIARVWTIDLISIGIVCEDGREYYAINRDLNLRHAKRNEWLKENVLDKLPPKTSLWPPHGSPRLWQETRRWLPMKQIKEEIIDFCSPIKKRYSEHGEYTLSNPEFYAYYADYDWVVFCWIFGRMIDLPGGFPMYCRDLKQMMDERGLSGEWKRENCPPPEGEHDALVDAKWNKQLYEILDERDTDMFGSQKKVKPKDDKI